jgi:DNA-directed RNA polymerase subunit RPC12/RpoP
MLDRVGCCGCRDGDDDSTEPRMILGFEMATIDQKERYRQRAALCHEIAATLSGDTARSMIRLGNSYAELANVSHGPRIGIFVPTKRHERPHCATCGKEMRSIYSLPRTDTLQAMQAFRCDCCNETVIWKER